MMEVKSEYVFEVSFEVCNKVGGIYTVVKSKAAQMNSHFKNYYLMGPYYKDRQDVEFEETDVPEEFIDVCNELKNEGIECHFGVWQIKGEPKVILVDFEGLKNQENDLKKSYWEHFQIDSLESGWDFIEPLLWSTACGKLIEKFSRKNEGKAISAQFHEWMSGFGQLWIKMTGANVGTVFTTHATILGRSIAGNGMDLYSLLDKIDPEKEAKKLGVSNKFSAERACAQTSNVFTTVSEITSIEAEKLLGRKADVLVLNGLDVGKFPSFEETSFLHIEGREKIREFLTYYFFPYYQFDIDHTLIFFVVGRYEYRNKGLDIFTKALGNLNNYLKKKGSKRTIATIFWIPGDAHGIKTDVLENKTYYRHIKNYVEAHSKDIEKKIVSDIVSSKDLTSRSIFSKEFLLSNKRHLSRFKRQGTPPLATHNIGNEENDSILKGFKEQGLNNAEDDRVKVILYPVYLNGVDGLIDLPYYDAMCGCHLGVFPSYYEPWGYTPVESAAMGVPSVCTDLSGFGRFIKPHLKSKTSGVCVLERYQKSEDEVLSEFTKFLCNYADLEHHERVKYKMDAKNLTQLIDWKEFVKYYIDAHNKSVTKK
jgi:glycogen(starch) synthase